MAVAAPASTGQATVAWSPGNHAEQADRDVCGSASWGPARGRPAGGVNGLACGGSLAFLATLGSCVRWRTACSLRFAPVLALVLGFAGAGNTRHCFQGQGGESPAFEGCTASASHVPIHRAPQQGRQSSQRFNSRSRKFCLGRGVDRHPRPAGPPAEERKQGQKAEDRDREHGVRAQQNGPA